MLEAAAHPARSARGHLRVARRRGPRPGLPRRRALRLVELDGAADRRAGGFSLGMRQRLGLASALIGDPRILVLDEPANGLDPEGIRWLRDFLRGLAGRGAHDPALQPRPVRGRPDGRRRGRDRRRAPRDPRAAAPANGHDGLARASAHPEPEALADAIRATTGRVIARDGDELLVAGAGQEAIGRLAFERGVVLYGLAAETDSLEDIFLNLTTTNHAEEAHR